MSTAGQPDEERTRLTLTVATLEAQRPVLGDAVIDLALAPLRQRLAELSGAPSQAGGDVGEHKVVTVVFADVSGFTAMSERLPSEEVRDIMNALFDRLVPAIERFGGVIDKFIGDEIMALFGAPRATEHHADHALRACLAMFDELFAFNDEHDLALGLHVGVNSGRVVAGGMGSRGRQEYSVLGDAVNVAARLEDASEVGEILVGPASYRAAAGAFTFEPLPPIALKGKSQPMPVYRLLGARPRPQRAVAFGLSFTGRDDELTRLLRAVRTGTSAMVVAAAPGLGKSRLLAEARDALGPRWPWFEVAALAHRSNASYAVFHELFDALIGVPPGADPDKVDEMLHDHLAAAADERLVAEAPLLRRFRGLPPRAGDAQALAGLAPDVLRRRSHDAVADLIDSVTLAAPAVVCVEDLHWADPSSIDLLTHLCTVRRVPNVTVLATTRPEGPGVVDLLGALRAADGVELMTLEPLGPDTVTELLHKALEVPTDAGSLRAALRDRSDGNPFYLTSYLRSLVDDGLAVEHAGRLRLLAEPDELRLPDSLHALVAERIDRLGVGARQLLRLAAVIGRRFRPDLLDALATATGHPTPTGAMEELRERQIVEPSDADHLQLVHAVVQDVAYQGMLGRERRRLHGTLAEVLAGGAHPDDALVAWHHEQAGERAAASVRYERAAARARAMFAHVDALAHVERALALADSDDGARTDDLHEQAGDLLLQTGRFTDASDRFAGPAARSSGLDAARRHRKHGHSLIACQRLADAEIAIGAAIGRVEESGTADRSPTWWRERFATYAERWWLLYLLSREDELRDLALVLDPELAQHGTRSERGTHHRNLALLRLRAGGFLADEETVRLAALGAAELEGDDDLTEACFAAFTHAFVLLWSGRLDDAERAMRSVLDTARRIGNAERHLLSLTYLAVIARFRGDETSTRAYATAGATAARTAGSRLYEGVCLANLAWVSWRAGGDRDRSELLPRLQTAHELMATMSGYPLLWTSGFVEIAVLAALDDDAGVAAVAERLLRPPQQRMAPPIDEALRLVAQQPSADRSRHLIGLLRSASYL